MFIMNSILEYVWEEIFILKLGNLGFMIIIIFVVVIKICRRERSCNLERV